MIMSKVYGLFFDQNSGSREDWSAFYILGSDKLELFSTEKERDERYEFLKKTIKFTNSCIEQITNGFDREAISIEKFEQDFSTVDTCNIPEIISETLDSHNLSIKSVRKGKKLYLEIDKISQEDSE